MRLTWVHTLGSACLLCVVVVNTLHAETKIKYGEWEVNVSIDGLPIAMPAQTQRICVDKDHLVPTETETHGCKIDWQINSNTVNWNVSCSNGITGKGRVVYNWDTLQGSSEMNSPASSPTAKMSLHSTQTGKWVSANCSAQSRNALQSNQLR